MLIKTNNSYNYLKETAMVIPHLRLRAIKRAVATVLMSALIFGMPGLTIRPALAIGETVTGTVRDTNSAAISGVIVELHTPDGLTSYQTTTAGDGTYSFSQALNSGTPYVVEARTPVNYVRISGGFNFTYSGVAQTGKIGRAHV